MQYADIICPHFQHCWFSNRLLQLIHLFSYLKPLIVASWMSCMSNVLNASFLQCSYSSIVSTSRFSYSAYAGNKSLQKYYNKKILNKILSNIERIYINHCCYPWSGPYNFIYSIYYQFRISFILCLICYMFYLFRITSILFLIH